MSVKYSIQNAEDTHTFYDHNEERQKYVFVLSSFVAKPLNNMAVVFPILSRIRKL